MVESLPATGGAGRNAGPANDPNAQEPNSFHIIHNFFRERFFKYFEMLQQSSYLIIEESLYPAIFYLLNPIP